MEVLEHNDQRLVEAFAQQDALEGILRALPPNLRIHLGERIVTLVDSEQTENVRHGVFQRTVEFE
jgi:hypothetical protein